MDPGEGIIAFVTSVFEPRRVSDVADLVRRQVLSLVVSHGPDGFLSTPLPLLVETDADGAPVSLLGHFARSNPQVALTQTHPHVLIQVLGPHGYVPPRWVSRPAWAPTWNYAYVAFETEVEFLPDQNDQAIRELARHLEPDGPDTWRVETMGERYAAMLPHVIAFRAHIQRISARFKLGQDEDDTTFEEILKHLPDQALARLMRDQRS